MTKHWRGTGSDCVWLGFGLFWLGWVGLDQHLGCSNLHKVKKMPVPGNFPINMDTITHQQNQDQSDHSEGCPKGPKNYILTISLTL